MRSHNELIKEAETLAEGKNDHDLALWGFIYSYIGNHEQRALWQRLGYIEKTLLGIGVPILLGIVTLVIKALLG